MLNADEWTRQYALAQYYISHNYPDLGFRHYRLAVEALRREGPQPGTSLEDLERRIVAMGDQLFRMRLDRAEAQLASDEADYNNRASVTHDPIVRAGDALSRRLADQARLNLEQAVGQMAITGPPNATQAQRENPAFRRLLDLYIQLGYLPEASMLITRPDARQRLQPHVYHQYFAQIATVGGKYEDALSHRQILDQFLRDAAVGQTLEGLAVQTLGGNSDRVGYTLNGVLAMNDGLNLVAQRADQMCHMGLIALEAGRTKEAAEFFRRAVEDIHGESSYRPLAARYYHLITGKHLGSAGK
jgi:tetratricopeptide (TPR) repeat protein